MRQVKFIKSLNIEILPLTKYNEVEYHTYNPSHVMSEYDPYFLHTKDVTTQVVPVNQFTKENSEGERVETYIAYSEEVEELLNMPFKSISHQIEMISRTLDIVRYTVTNATFIKRLKYLFTRKLL